jgi:hypothetical protein
MNVTRASVPRWLACAGLMVVATVAHAGDKFPKCFDAAREGDCVVVTVNGQKAVRLTRKTKKALEALGALRAAGDSTRYEIPQPIRGELSVEAAWLPEAAPYFGAPDVTVMVYALEGQDLDTRPELSSDPTVQIGGSAAVTRSDVLQDNTLPPGKYLLSVRASGSNWDRQTLFFQVVD